MDIDAVPEDLKARIDYLEEVHRFTVDALEMAASLGDFQSSINGLQEASAILRETGARVRRLIPFQAMAFYRVDETNNDFQLANCEPESGKDFLKEEVEFLIENGTFAWALRENRAIRVSTRDFQGQILLHVMATRSRIRGLFAGILPPKDKNVSEVSLSLLSIILLNSANTLESYELYAMVQKARNELEDRVKERTEKMISLQEQLRQAQKMEAVGQLAGGIAHDFNNILTVINGRSELALLNLEEKDPLRVDIEEIKGASERAASLTQQLLAFSRRQILEIKVLDLNTVLLDLNKMLRRVIGEDIELVTFLGSDLGKIKSDPGQLEQMIINLAVNARDAMPRGGKLILETENVELDEAYTRSHAGVKPGPYVRLSVSDTGTGMKPDVKERIFEPFFTTKEKGKGTGLGLSLVYGIVKQCGGNIWVYSEPGEGTVFKICLPREDEAAEERVKQEVQRVEAPRGHETVLLVEDERDVRELASLLLKKQGYTVMEAQDGEDALQICGQYQGLINLMVTDVVMPGISGRELAEHVALLRPEMKVVYMSGYTDDAIIHHGVLEKGVNFIQKPFALLRFAQKVREVLDESGTFQGYVTSSQTNVTI